MLLNSFQLSLRCSNLVIKTCLTNVSSRSYAIKTSTSTASGGIVGLGKGKKVAKIGSAIEKKELEVEMDTEKLASFLCGSNIYVTGEDVKLKADSEYPDWLWNLRTGRAPTLEEMDPNSKEYWLKVRKLGMRRKNKLIKLKKF